LADPKFEFFIEKNFFGITKKIFSFRAYLSAQEKREEALQQMCVDEMEELLAPVGPDSGGRTTTAKSSSTNFDGNASIRRVAAQNGGCSTNLASSTQINSLDRFI